MSQTGIPTFVCKLVLPCQPYSGRFVLKLNVTMRWVSETNAEINMKLMFSTSKFIVYEHVDSEKYLRWV